ncbi:MAG: conjugal transfer protein TraF, partial [Gemmatimonadota bacterium]
MTARSARAGRVAEFRGILASVGPLVGILAGSLILAAVTADRVEAQLAHASASTLGLAENTTATARGFEAISVNPAGLGMPGSGFSLALAPVRVRTALHPVTLSDVAEYEGVEIPDATKEEWLTDVIDAGGEIGALGADVSGLALTVGNLGLQVSTLASGDVSVPPGVVEALLFGNAGRTGMPSDLSLDNGSANVFAATTGGLSLAVPLEVVGWQASLGATVKYTVGHAVLVGRSVGGSIRSDPVSVEAEFPVVLTAEEFHDDFDGGRGVGLDVGFMMQMDDLHLGATIQNLFNTFEWDESKLAFVPGTASLQQGSNGYDFVETSYDQASPEAREFIGDMTFQPTASVGSALD